ncbi:MAG: FIST C-terminal domain-containing protein [Verrucomicrobia bacterium]|nr:FIST C-terminal domain-containing protein [Verrucomicrobiota bacterium]
MTDEQSGFSVAGHWAGKFDEAGLQAWASALHARLHASQVSLGLVFMSPRFFSQAATVLELFRVHARIPLLIGCSGNWLIAGDEEIEEHAGVVLGLYHLPGADLKACHFTQAEVEEANGSAYWHAATGVGPKEASGWLAFADPFHMDCEAWLREWNEAYAPLPVFGGLASGPSNEAGTQLYLNGEVFDEGGVAVAISGDTRLEGVVSQGCTPIGDIWTITRSERNVVFQIANRRAYDVLAETFNQLPPDEQRKARDNLFVGLVANEYLEEFHRGDFLIRNLMAADPGSGALAVGALPRIGQSIQFQRRDAATATADITGLLQHKKERLGSQRIFGGLLCSCNGRGQRLFKEPNHDARHVQEVLGPFGLTGFFGNGEIGPIGQKSFLHGFTASLALFVGKQEA